MDPKLQKQFEDIARKYLMIDTLEERRSGLDFHEVSVWAVKSALEAAYRLGLKSTG
jgi:hypothetical protein